MLRHYERLMQGPAKLPHWSREKVLLRSVNQFVPKRLDWRVKLPRALPKQKFEECYALNVYRSFKDLGKFIQKNVVLPYEDMLFTDFRNTPSGGSLEVALQQGMLQGIYTPRCEDDEFPSFGDKVPLSGYFKLPPMNEELFIRTLAQQPVLSSIHVGEKFMEYKGGVFKGETHDFLKVKPDEEDQVLNHAVTAVAYDEDTIVLRNTWGKNWGDNGDITIERGHPRGVNEVYSNCFIPFMYNHMTEYNKMLIKMNLHFDHNDMSNYCARDLKTMLYDKTFPVELKALYMDDVAEYWNEVRG